MKIKEITPAEFVCHTSDCCPAVFETDNDSYIIIGKKLLASAKDQLNGRVADDEFAIEVSKAMIDGIK